MHPNTFIAIINGIPCDLHSVVGMSKIGPDNNSASDRNLVTMTALFAGRLKIHWQHNPQCRYSGHLNKIAFNQALSPVTWMLP